MDDLWTTYRQPIDNLRTTDCAYINWQYNSKLFTHSLTNGCMYACENCTDASLHYPLVGANANAPLARGRHLGDQHYQYSPTEESERRRLRHRRPPTIPATLVEKAVESLVAQPSVWVRDVNEDTSTAHG